MVITVMRDGTVYFVRDRVVPYQLHSKILDRLKDRTSESRVYIRADVRGTVRLRKSSTACVLQESNKLHSWSISVGLQWQDVNFLCPRLHFL